MDAPCVDIFELENGKIKKFDCYPEGSVILTQLGVIENLGAALTHKALANNQSIVGVTVEAGIRVRLIRPVL
jgi:hypothetical protein